VAISASARSARGRLLLAGHLQHSLHRAGRRAAQHLPAASSARDGGMPSCVAKQVTRTDQGRAAPVSRALKARAGRSRLWFHPTLSALRDAMARPSATTRSLTYSPNQVAIVAVVRWGSSRSNPMPGRVAPASRLGAWRCGGVGTGARGCHFVDASRVGNLVINVAAMGCGRQPGNNRHLPLWRGRPTQAFLVSGTASVRMSSHTGRSVA